MSAHRSRRGPDRCAAARMPAARLRWITATAAAAICGLLALGGVVPAASAAILGTDPGGFGGVTPQAPVRVVTAGGMAGWQITLIALGAALVAAAAAVMLDRALAVRRAVPVLTVTRPGQPQPDQISSPPDWR